MRSIIIIPVYQPTESLIKIVQAILNCDKERTIVVVDDGSDQSTDTLFQKLQQFSSVVLLRHEVNRGKGAALKTAFREVVRLFDGKISGVITVDADGQHAVEDIFKLEEAFSKNPTALWIGERYFEKQSVPLRSRLGNSLTGWLFKFFFHEKLKDTQSGLRAIPFDFLKALLKLESSGYEFEFEMLFLAEKQQIPIKSISIKTLYFDDNKASHFNPFFDSLKIYFVFLRFLAGSITTALVDTIAFWVCYFFAHNILISLIVGRFFGGTYSFLFGKHLTFKSGGKLWSEVIKFFGLVLALMIVAYLFIGFLSNILGINVYLSKVISEGVLFFVSFTIQRMFVFQDRSLKNRE